MNNKETIDYINKSLSEIWTKTMDLRWYEKGFKYVTGPFDIQTKIPDYVLQQKLQGSHGNVKWVDVEFSSADNI